ncbi:MAG: glycosyltransferase family 4 protein [Candidatus Altiarchaeota archaeon]
MKDRLYRSFFRKFKPDVIHVHNISRFGLGPIKVAKKEGIPIVWTFHDYAGVCPNTLLFRPNRTVCKDRTQCMSCNNLVVPYNYSQLYELLDDVSCVVASDYVKSQYAEVISTKRVYWDADPFLLDMPSRDFRGRTILFGGRLDEEKGVRFAIIAFKRIVGKYPDSRLILAGTYRQDIFTRLLRIYDIEKNVDYVGSMPWQEYINTVRNSAAVLCTSIWAEPFNLSMLEAMALGKPVIATGVGGQTEVVGDSGIIIQPKSSHAIFEAVCDIFSDRGRYKQLCEKGKKRAKNFRGGAEEYLKIYESLI